MADSPPLSPSSIEPALRAEIERLNKITNALMDRAERSTQAQASEFAIFQSHILFDRQIHLRTAELEAAFRENQKVYQALKESESRFRGLVNQSLVGIAIIEDSRFSYANPKLASMFGYTVDEILQRSLNDILPPLGPQAITEHIQSHFCGDCGNSAFCFQGRRNDGSLFEAESHASVMEMDGKSVLICMMTDITERMKEQRQILALQQQLSEQAIHDPLTGLYNRLPLNEFFDREIHAATRKKRPISVIFADLDHFKNVNDTFGHQAGDEALKAFGQLLLSSCRASDICCRYGGEEFLVLLPDMPLDRAFTLTNRIRAHLEKIPLHSGDAEFHLTASFGIAAFPIHGRSRDALITAADHALYAAKHSGRNRVCLYSPESTVEK
ncbi:MAG: sensor domain-containing diguanylate cyclase [Terracidiphilus sp.]|nr:sensor domain-containing diguanylate cyclase [Terracidiphilus sp.]